MNPKYKRRIFFVDKEYQGKMIFNYFVLLALGSLIFVAIFSFFSSNTLSIVYEDYHLQLGTTPGILFKKILSTQWLFIVLGGFFICFITLRLTHRVAGPFYRFENSLDIMTRKDISRKIVLRQKDEGKALAQKINTFNGMLSRDLAHIEELCAQIGAAAGKLESEKGNGSDLVEQIKQGHQGIEAKLNEYIVQKDLGA